MKILIGNFTEMSIRNFLPDRGSEIVNQHGQQTNSLGNLCYCPKMRALLVPPKDYTR